MLIGFRSPVPGKRALLATLRNPVEVIEGKPAKFGPPLLLDLGGLGLRGMCTSTNGYYLLAGSTDGGGASHLFLWDGHGTTPQLLKELHFSQSNPEGICWLDFGGQPDFLIVSDRPPAMARHGVHPLRPIGIVIGPLLTIGGLFYLASAADYLRAVGRF